MALVHQATVTTGGTGTITATLSSAQAPSGAMVVAIFGSDAAAATANSQFASQNTGWTACDLSGPTGLSGVTYAKILTSAGCTVSLTTAAGTDKILFLHSFTGHDGTLPTATTQQEHTDSGSYSGAAPTAKGSTMSAGTHGGFLIADIITEYSSTRTAGCTGCTTVSGVSMPNSGTTATSLQAIMLSRTLTASQSPGNMSPTISPSAAIPISAMWVIVNDDGVPATSPVTTTDSATVTDTSSLLGIPAPSTETATTTDSSSLSVNQLTTDSALLTETSSVNVSTTDAATVTDTSSIYKTVNLSTNDSATLTEGTSTSSVTEQTTDTSAVTDSSQVTGTFVKVDSATFTESSSLLAMPSTTDSATTTDASLPINTSTQATGTETFGFSESSSVVVTINTSDSAGFTDGDTESEFYNSTDSATLTDSSSLFSATSTTDSASTTDTSSPINSSTQITSTETYSFSESSSLFATRSTTDSATFSDGDTDSGTFSRTDSATLSETSQINQSRTDSASLTETSQVGQSRADSATVTDTSKVSLNLTDAASLAETSKINEITTDSATFSESSQLQVTINTQDTIAFSDGPIASINRPIVSPNGDNFTFIEQAVADVLPRYTEDNIYYLPQDTQNKKFRIIAQDHFTREFIHWNLPLDSIQLTYSLNGPNLLVGILSSEMDSIMSLDPPLIPDRTWLHVEEDGIIRGSFIMTPFIDSPANQTRQIEGEGFSAYPSWVVYQGLNDPAGGYVGIQVDPADMIRKIWDEVQGYPDGNLNVTVSPTKTPVKIGEPPESVNFTTSEGNNVSFQAGPYSLNFWSVTNCGDEITSLSQQAPIDYQEFSKWNDNKTDVLHTLVLGYPRLGTKRYDLGFRQGQNLTQLIPSYQGSNENYASDVIVIGAGTGPSAVRAISSGRIGLLRKTNVIQNQDITNHSRAQAIADFEFKRIAHSRFLIENITVDCTDENSLWGSFQSGDDILVQATVDYIGYIQDWYRITSYNYDPYNKIAIINLAPSDSFTYGAENVDPYDELPTSGYAQLETTQDFSNILDPTQNTDADQWEVQKVANMTQNAQQYSCTYFNKNGLTNGSCYYWYFDGKRGLISGISFPEWKVAKGTLDDLSISGRTMTIGKTDYGHIITGDNIQLVSADGTVGQNQNTTSEIAYPKPYIPVPSSAAHIFGVYEITDTDQSTSDNQTIYRARQDGLIQFTTAGITLGQALFIRTATDGTMSLTLGTIGSMGASDVLIIEIDTSGTVNVGPGIQINEAGQSLTGLQQAAQAIFDRINSGLAIDTNWSWTGEPTIVANYSDILIEKFYGYHNITVPQFLTAAIQGQIT